LVVGRALCCRDNHTKGQGATAIEGAQQDSEKIDKHMKEEQER
jgi:hypothetical protein